MKRIVSEPEFRNLLSEALKLYVGKVKSVTGPGRSGAIASVYASHALQIPWLPSNYKGKVPEDLQPVLVIDTALMSGATLRKAVSHIDGRTLPLFLYKEPPRVIFWYETSIVPGTWLVDDLDSKVYPDEDTVFSQEFWTKK